MMPLAGSRSAQTRSLIATGKLEGVTCIVRSSSPGKGEYRSVVASCTLLAAGDGCDAAREGGSIQIPLSDMSICGGRLQRLARGVKGVNCGCISRFGCICVGKPCEWCMWMGGLGWTRPLRGSRAKSTASIRYPPLEGCRGRAFVMSHSPGCSVIGPTRVM